MTPISFEQARADFPDLVLTVINKLSAQVPNLDPGAIAWASVVCHDDPDQPLDEGAIADLMLTGRIPCRFGLAGSLNGYYGCACQQQATRPGDLRSLARQA